MKLRIKTDTGAEVILEWIPDGGSKETGYFKIRAATSISIRNSYSFSDLIIGCRVQKPKVLMPLTIFLNATDTLTSSRIKSIEEIT